MLNPRFWFHPCRSGDFRLLRLDATRTRLTVEDPTRGERAVLARLLATAKERAWLPQDAALDLPERGVAVFELDAPIGALGPLVSANLHGDAKTWTAIRHEQVGGHPQIVLVQDSELRDPEERAEAEIDAALDAVNLVDRQPVSEADPRLLVACPSCGVGAGVQCTTSGLSPRHRAPHKARKAAVLRGLSEPGGQLPANIPPEPQLPMTGTDATAAVTVRQPQRGCPAPEAATRRASQVLRAFSTVEQWTTWEAQGWMSLIGNRTGQQYHLFHRDEAHRRRMGHVLVEARSGAEVCCWDDRVPPEEEALGVKLAVEHREGWMLRLPRGVVRLGAPSYV